MAVFMHTVAGEVIWAMRAVEADQWVLGQVRAAPIQEVRRPIHLPQLQPRTAMDSAAVQERLTRHKFGEATRHMVEPAGG